MEVMKLVMTSYEINFESLQEAIRKHKLMKFWQDGLFVESEDEGKART